MYMYVCVCMYIYIYIHTYILGQEKVAPRMKMLHSIHFGTVVSSLCFEVMHYKLNILLGNEFSKMGSQKDEAWRSEY